MIIATNIHQWNRSSTQRKETKSKKKTIQSIH